jgi:hypothetical protein
MSLYNSINSNYLFIRYNGNVDNTKPSEFVPVSLQTSFSFDSKSLSSPDLIIFASNQKKRYAIDSLVALVHLVGFSIM